MGSKYTAGCATYPYKGYNQKTIQSNYLFVFMLKVIIASKKHQIIDIQYRNCL